MGSTTVFWVALGVLLSGDMNIMLHRVTGSGMSGTNGVGVGVAAAPARRPTTPAQTDTRDCSYVR